MHCIDCLLVNRAVHLNECSSRIIECLSWAPHNNAVCCTTVQVPWTAVSVIQDTMRTRAFAHVNIIGVASQMSDVIAGPRTTFRTFEMTDMQGDHIPVSTCSLTAAQPAQPNKTTNATACIENQEMPQYVFSRIVNNTPV